MAISATASTSDDEENEDDRENYDKTIYTTTEVQLKYQKELPFSSTTLKGLVSVSQSELQDDLTDDETQGHQRLRLLALWKFEIGDYLTKPFKPLDLFFDARYYQDFGRPDAIEDIDPVSNLLNFEVCYKRGW